MNPEVVSKLVKILGRDRVVADETELLVYECDGLPLFKTGPMSSYFRETQKMSRRSSGLPMNTAFRFCLAARAQD